MRGTALAVGFALAAVVVGSRFLARRSSVPYPVFLVVAGAAASFVPHIPEVRLDPKVVFLGFLPPLVYHAGFVTSPRELRANAAPIGLSALGLVLATTFAVAAAVWAAPTGLAWGPAFVLGAVVAPTDPVSATAVLNRLGAPPRITTILEGESLVNDGIALSLFAIGVASVTVPTSVGAGALSFLKVAGGGAVFGLAVGFVASRLRRPLADASSQIVISLLVPFVAYVPADALGLSGVLSALVAGLVVGQQPLAALQPAGRLQAAAFWEVLVFLLESALFVLVGVQLRFLVADIAGYSPAEIAWTVGLTVAAVTVVRMAWQLGLPSLRFRPEGRLVDTGQIPRAQRVALGWSGLRGAISLAAALSIPQVSSGRPFPGRELIVFATFSVIVVTLVGQGTSLSWLLRRLGMVGSDAELRQHAVAHRRLAEAALRRLDELVADDQIGSEVADLVRQRQERRLARSQSADTSDPAGRPGGGGVEDVERRILTLQRRLLRQLHREGQISFSVMRDLDTELDLEQAQLGH
ncbi:MAG TPA: Na+/H+ antiporter [Acidimicrobiales bacterium]|nr:Na+/H+ antiporter [Acidimicrobiales bacterium]